MRRLFIIITIIYLFISTIGILSVSTRLKIIKGKTESLSEAQRSLMKRAEFKDVIYEISRSIEQKEGKERTVYLIGKAKKTIEECYECHHPSHIYESIKATEIKVNDLPSQIEKPEKLLAQTIRIIPFVETAYERATLLAKIRLESATKELKRAEKAIAVTVASGAILFLTISGIALYRVTILQSRIKERERSLKNWAEQWQQTFDSIQDCLIIVDYEGNIRQTNKSSRNLFGEDIINRPIADVLNIPSFRKAEDLFGKSDGIEFSRREKIFKLKTYPHYIDFDKGGYIIVIRDITVEKEMEQRLIQAEKLSALSRTMATVATELYNPLTSVSKYSEVLLDLSSINKRIREIADKISTSTSRMSGIVGELLLFSKVPALNKRPVDYESLIEGILKLLKEGVDIGKINLIVEAERATIYVDRTKIERALLGLITNSINRINQSGKGNWVLVKGYKEKGLFHIDISDNGPFIPREMSLRLFEPFFSDGDRKTGLDLSISYNIIKAHEGDIIVRSTEEETIFSVELPLS